MFVIKKKTITLIARIWTTCIHFSPKENNPQTSRILNWC